MKTNFHTATATAMLALVFAGPAFAQYEGEIEIPENVLDAIREFNERGPDKPNEVVVVLDPPTEAEEIKDEDAPEDDEEIRDEEKIEDGDDDEVDDVVASILADESVEAIPGEPAPQGPEVRVQSLRNHGTGDIQAADVKINAPFAAKPLGRPSDGWKLVSSPDVPAFAKNVEVAPGTWLTLSIRPHVLVPEADGQSVFQIVEPGFDPALGYQQETTVSSSIASSIRQIEADSRVLGQVIDDLEQILISLPRPANVVPNDNENSQ